LDLDRGRALSLHLLDVPRDVCGELLVGGGAGGRDGGADPAGGVRLAGHPGRELLRAVAGEHQVAVAVDEAGEHGAAARADDLVGGGGRGGRADPADPGAVDDQRSVAEDAEKMVSSGMVLYRTISYGTVPFGIVRDELTDVGDQDGHSAPIAASSSSP